MFSKFGNQTGPVSFALDSVDHISVETHYEDGKFSKKSEIKL